MPILVRMWAILANAPGMPDGAPRIHGFDYAGAYRYALTVCTHARRAMFMNAELVATVLGEIEAAAEIEEVEILAYCFMPDHLHLLAQGESDTSDLTRFVKRWKPRTPSGTRDLMVGVCGRQAISTTY